MGGGGFIHRKSCKSSKSIHSFTFSNTFQWVELESDMADSGPRAFHLTLLVKWITILLQCSFLLRNAQHRHFVTLCVKKQCFFFLFIFFNLWVQKVCCVLFKSKSGKPSLHLLGTFTFLHTFLTSNATKSGCVNRCSGVHDTCLIMLLITVKVSPFVHCLQQWLILAITMI